MIRRPASLKPRKNLMAEVGPDHLTVHSAKIMIAIFISYSRKDSEVVARLVEKLKAAGHEVWWDMGIPGGTLWQKQIVMGLKKSSAFLLVVSKDSVKSNNVLKELTLASEKGKNVYPVFLHDVEVPEEMELALSGIQRIDFHSRDFDAASAHLLRALEPGKIIPVPEPPEKKSKPQPIPPFEPVKPVPPPFPPDPRPAAVFCIHCGGRNAPDNVFCFQCGKRLK